MFRGQATTNDGKLKFSKRFSKRSKKWHAEPVKQDKTFPHIPYVMAKVLQARKNDGQSIARQVPLPANHLRLISPTIALRASPALDELVSQHITRYSSNPSPSTGDSSPTVVSTESV